MRSSRIGSTPGTVPRTRNGALNLPSVYVTTVNPGPIRTGFFDQADPDGTYLKSVERFLLEPDAVAKKIVKTIGKNKRELNLPLLLNLAHKFYTLFPKLADKLAGGIFNYK